jgi:hypothetical protein
MSETEAVRMNVHDWITLFAAAGVRTQLGLDKYEFQQDEKVFA